MQQNICKADSIPCCRWQLSIFRMSQGRGDFHTMQCFHIQGCDIKHRVIKVNLASAESHHSIFVHLRKIGRKEYSGSIRLIPVYFPGTIQAYMSCTAEIKDILIQSHKSAFPQGMLEVQEERRAEQGGTLRMIEALCRTKITLSG